MNTDLRHSLQRKLQQREEQGIRRTLPPPMDGIDFFSNDYLGLATRSLLPHTGLPSAPGATGSRLLSGNSIAAEELEQYLAGFHEAEACLLFNSGYSANTGLLACIADRHCTFLYDELCHASIIDGIRLSQARHSFRFRHNDTGDLALKLEKYALQGPVIVVTESVFSMDGDLAPLEAIARLTQQHQASLVVDEAHATGVFGKGRGWVQELGLQEQVFARVHTFGKAIGCHGAVVAGSTLLKDYLLNFSRPFVYTTALPAYSLVLAHHAYQYVAQHPELVQQLHERIRYFRSRISPGSNGWRDSHSPVQALVAGSGVKARNLSQALRQQGIRAAAILSPTVAAGTERLRICLHAFNTPEEIDLLLETIGSCNTE